MTNRELTKKQGQMILNQIDQLQQLAVERIIPNAFSSAVAERRKLQPHTSHQGKRDYNKLLGYPLDIDEDQIYTRYQRIGELQRAIKSTPALAWRRPPAVFDDNGLDGDFAVAFKKLVKQIKLFDYMQRLDRLARLYPYAVLIIGYNDGGRKLEESVDVDTVKRNKTEPILYLRVRGKRSVRISELDDNQASRRFGQPFLYELEKDTLDDEQTSGNSDTNFGGEESGRKITISYQRILHVIHEPLESELYGESIAVSIWNLLDDLLKGVSGPIEGNWRGAVSQRLNIKLKDDVDFTDPETGEIDTSIADEISNKLNDMVNNITSAIVSQYIDEIDEIGGEATDPSKTAEVIWRRIALTIGEPYKMFAGTVQGNTSNLQDKFDQAAIVQSYQEHQCEARMLRPLISTLVAYGALPAPNGEIKIGEYNAFSGRYQWPSPVDINPVELAQASRDQSRAALFLAQARQLGIPIEDDEVRRAAGLAPADESLTANVSEGARKHAAQNGHSLSAYRTIKKKLRANAASPVGELEQTSVATSLETVVQEGIREQLAGASIDRIARDVDAAPDDEKHEVGRASAATYLNSTLFEHVDDAVMSDLLYTLGQSSSLELFDADHDDESEAASELIVQAVAIGLVSALLGSDFPADAQTLNDALDAAGEIVGLDIDELLRQAVDAATFVENSVDVATANRLGEIIANENLEHPGVSETVTQVARQLDELAEDRAGVVASGGVRLIYRSAGIAAGIVTAAQYKEWLLTTSKEPRDVHLAQVGYVARFMENFPDGSFWSNELYGCKCGIKLLY